MNWEWLSANRDTLVEHLSEHVQITLAAVLLGVAVAFPIGLAAHRWQGLSNADFPLESA